MRPLPPVGDVRLELSPSPPLPLPAVSGSPVGSSGRLMAASSSLVPDRLRLPLCFLGVFVCYFYYGILQEKITRGKYGEGAKPETFTFALTLVFIQCVINAVFAKILIQFFDTARVDRTRSWLYAACSVSYLGAMVSSNSALQFVNYPTQVLGKSCKPIPVTVSDPGRTDRRFPGPHAGSLPNGLQPHDVEHQPLVDIAAGSWHPVHWRALGVLELCRKIPYHHLQHPALWSDQRPGAEFHLHDGGVFWPPDLLHHHDNSQVLHHFGLCDPLCQPHQPPAVGGHRARVLGSRSRCQVWERSQEDVPLGTERLPSLQAYLSYYLKYGHLLGKWTQ
ncbi:solute carrier family 35 member B1 isoform X3 [Acinonyx jubatus]|uniref:Solute carrier family 35 member B1 n=1 Tax=Acinonyx jubatus TaxID=32536 RepID=A0ABM3PAI8_ACIJB|nr:solute carrier family 35 member B1 isoform X3 [Acinonyx jubatus]